MMIMKMLATLPLLLISIAVCWWMLNNEKGIDFIWLPFLIPAILQFAMVFFSNQESELVLKIFGGINIAFAILAAIIVWYLHQLARAFKN
ncbi:MAG: hypothetical protein K0Q59_5615 [Paenibacillus sp.]|nr:hypothetical protein [Paenibacillus sp.]